jgi:hypothetical protein
MADHDEQTKPEVVVLGAGQFMHTPVSVYILTWLRVGVIGLTTALKIIETGQYTVSILAETLPSDPKSIRYTSHWAVRPFSSPLSSDCSLDSNLYTQGAHHVSLAGDDLRQRRASLSLSETRTHNTDAV